MDIEQLKLILEMVGVATDSAVTVAVVFAVLPLLEIMLYFLGWWLMLPVISNTINSFIKSFD